MRLRWLYGILIVQQTLAAGTFLAAKWALLDFPPLPLAFVRFFIASTGLYLIHRFWPGRKPVERSDWPALLLLSFLIVPVNQAFFLYGMKYTTPTHAALLYGMTPVLVFVMAIIMLGERPTLMKKIGIPIAFAGVAVVISQKGLAWSPKARLGDFLVFMAVIAWAVTIILGKRLIARYGAVHLTAIAMVVGTALFIPVGVFTVGSVNFAAVSARGWWSLMYIAVGTSVIVYPIWFWALGRLEATKVSIFANLQPVVAAILSYFFLGEQIGARLIVGGALVILGVLLTERG
ncbi:MAG: DMT family transporter [candidate division Zixibacteria bacterium]|nr:DMT family transporter [candidate division Zixibacteria bacterium]